MGVRGPAAKPTQLKLIQGTFRKDRASANEPKPETKIPTCPSWLSKEAKREWRRIVPELERLNLITLVDRAALAAYCQAYAEWQEMEKALIEHGRTQYTENGFVVARPEVAMRNKALETMKAFLVQFGLTPSSRTRLSVPAAAEPDKKSNAFAALG